MIITRTPLRVSFFGGGTDYPAWFQEHGGAVLATTIDKYIYLHCRYLPPFFDFQEETPKGHHSWFGFPIRVKGNAGFKVTELTKALNAKHVETRPIIAGNIARQPALKMYEHRVVGDMKHSNAVMDGAFSFGNHQDVDSGARQYVAEQVRSFLRSRGLT